MIYFSGLDSIIESLYLDEILDDKVSSCNIFVNPENVSYLTGKIIIINNIDYPLPSIKTLINNRNKIISRINLINKDSFVESNIKINPYVIRPVFNIMWGGDDIEVEQEEVLNGISDSVFDRILEGCNYVPEKRKLFFPKLHGSGIKRISVDEDGNLTSIGYSLQQVGVNITYNTPFIDMDVLKTKKLNL